eukprot:g11510.t1
MPTGKLKKFVSDKGFGFITPDEGGEDIFAHTLQFVGDGDTLRGGERVTYEAEWDDRKGKYRASTWTVDASGAGAAMLPGVLKKYFTGKGFGFIEPQDGSEDLFAHQRQFSGDPNSIQDGMKVKYEVEWDGLPPGWESAQDPASGKTYYFNRATNETSWTPPAAPAAPPPAPAMPSLPPGWESAQDPASGKTYYFNRATNETRWDPPM